MNKPLSKRESDYAVANQVLLYLLLLGFGVIGGTVGFYGLWHTRCTQLLHVAEARHNQSSHTTSLHHYWSLKAKQHAAEKASLDANVSKYELHDRLQAQITLLSGKHQDLLEQHQATLEKLGDVQKAHDSSMQTTSFLNEQIKRLQRELGQATIQNQLAKRTAEKKSETLASQLQLSRSMLLLRDQKDAPGTDTTDPAVSTADSDTAATSDVRYKQELVTLQTAVRRYSLAQLRLRYGPGPYAVEFTVDLPSSWMEHNTNDDDDGDDGDNKNTLSSQQSTFIIEFRLLPEMAFTIETFLRLVSATAYDGTTIGSLSAAINTNGDTATTVTSLIGGAPTTQKGQAALTKRLTELGYGPAPLFLQEVSPRAPCLAYSFGFVDQGPGFVLPLVVVPQDQTDASVSCPGTVVAGKETVSRLSHLSNNDSATIVRAKIVETSPSWKEEEDR